LTRPNQEWAIDFVTDGLATGRGLRIVTVVDSFTRECPAIEVDTGMSSWRVTRILDWVISQRGKPDVLRCDNGPEFTSRHFLAWCEERGIRLLHIQPGRPMQNGHVESFNGRFRDECLNHNWRTRKKRSSACGWNTTRSVRTAVWHTEHQRSLPTPAQSSPTG
jgi:putative transposase